MDALSRRAMLTGSLGGSAVALAAVSGCGTPADSPPALSPGPDVTILTGAIEAETRLLAQYDAVIAAHPGQAARLRPLREHHAQHLAVLKRNYVPGSRTGTATPQPSAAATAAGGVAGLRAAERKAASARATEATHATPALAQLLASIGACEAGHAAELA